MVKTHNIVHSLTRRERGLKNNTRCILKSLSKLVCSEDVSFKRVWEKHSNKSISYEWGRIYFDNYRSCYNVYGKGGVPSLSYRLPACDLNEKIEEGLICQGSLDLSQVPTEHKGYRASFLALTANNWLVRYDINTGEILQRVYLSSRHKFRHISWDCDEYTVVLKSTHNKMSAISREAGITQTLLMSLVVFKVFPLEFVALMDVTKQIFGHDISDSMLSQGALIVMHQGGMVRLYSFDQVLQMGLQRHYKLGESTSGCATDTVGSYPKGLPLNIKLTERPPLLFEVQCAEHNLSLGGIPWHYIITPPSYKGFFKVYSLEDRQLAAGGCLDLDTVVSVEPDKCLFHPDDSGKILLVGSKEIQVLKIGEEDTPSNGLPKTKVKKLFTIKPFNEETKQMPYFSSSGRVIKKSYVEDMVLDEYQSIPTVDYENDLDLLYMSVVSQGQSSSGLEGKVQIYDNGSGKLLKQLDLVENWKEFCDHIISLDVDTLVHIVKAPMRKFSCYVYRLHRPYDHSADSSPDRKKERRSRTQEALEEELFDISVRRSSSRRRNRSAVELFS